MPLAARRLSAKQSFWILRSQAELGNESEVYNKRPSSYTLQTHCRLINSLNSLLTIRYLPRSIFSAIPFRSVAKALSRAGPFFASFPSSAWERHTRKLRFHTQTPKQSFVMPRFQAELGSERTPGRRQRKCTKPGNDFMKSLPPVHFRTGINDVRPACSSDRIFVGVHFQKISPFVCSLFLLPLFLICRFQPIFLLLNRKRIKILRFFRRIVFINEIAKRCAATLYFASKWMWTISS